MRHPHPLTYNPACDLRYRAGGTRIGLKTVVRVSQVSADESMRSVVGGWGAAGAIPRAQGDGGGCE
jgi:hypothetical protein